MILTKLINSIEPGDKVIIPVDDIRSTKKKLTSYLGRGMIPEDTKFDKVLTISPEGDFVLECIMIWRET